MPFEMTQVTPHAQHSPPGAPCPQNLALDLSTQKRRATVTLLEAFRAGHSVVGPGDGTLRHLLYWSLKIGQWARRTKRALVLPQGGRGSLVGPHLQGLSVPICTQQIRPIWFRQLGDAPDPGG